MSSHKLWLAMIDHDRNNRWQFIDSHALRQETVLLHDGDDVCQVDLRADLQIRLEAFSNNLSSPFATSEHLKQVVSIGYKELVSGPGGIAELTRAIRDAEQAIDQHPAAYGVFQAETAMAARAYNEDVEAGAHEPARAGRHIQE